jgi:organic radical activating enzyme
MNKFCPLPWMHLASHPAGYVTLCCESDHTGLRNASYDKTDLSCEDGQPSFYNLKYHKLDEVMNSESFREVRLQILDRKIPTQCSGCFEKEAKGLESKRTREMRNFPHFTEKHARSITTNNGTITFQPEFVELRLGNLCNARCVTCNPLSSSQWRQDYLSLSEKFDFLRDRYQLLDNDRFVTWPTGFADSNVFEMDWPKSDIFWDDLFAYSTNLRVIYINGGEPTLIKKHWEFLENLVLHNIAQNVELHYSINATNLPDFAHDIWAKFKKVRVSCSVDAVGERNTYIRFPSVWSVVADNVAKLISKRTVEVSVTQTISVFNYDTLDVFYDQLTTSGVHVHYNFVNDPAYYSPNIIPQEYRHFLHARYKETLPGYLYNQLVTIYNDTECDIENLKKFKDITIELDKLRGTDFAKTFPELHKWLT